MKINWGVGITITIIVFTLASFWFIHFAFNQDVNLVRDDYYEEEVKHQDKIDKIKRTQNLKEPLNIKLETGKIVFNFPQTSNNNNTDGTILLYRPANRNLDKSFPILIDSTHTQVINLESILPGLWKVQVNWSIDTLQYFTEKIFMIQ